MKTGKFKIAASSSAVLLVFLAWQLLQPHPATAAGPPVVVI
jgi:hypothetical protein